MPLLVPEGTALFTAKRACGTLSDGSSVCYLFSITCVLPTVIERSQTTWLARDPRSVQGSLTELIHMPLHFETV
jgi:hypothetical protein